MKKQYEQPMAEKIEFNYKDTVVASTTPGGLHEGANINGCYHAANSNKPDCIPWYGPEEDPYK